MPMVKYDVTETAQRPDKASIEIEPATIRIAPMVAWIAFAIVLSGSNGFGVGTARAQSCSIGTGSGAYGNVAILSGAAADSSSTFTVSCTGTANQTVRLCIEWGAGNSPDASGNRLLHSTTDSLRHDFFTTSARATIWGSWGSQLPPYTPYPFGAQQDLALGGAGSNSVVLTVYGRLYANQQTATPGSYAWTSGGSPSLQYGYAGSTSCPVGGKTTSSSGSSWTATVLADANVSVTSMDFGSTSTLSSNIDATATITVQATNTTPYSIGLDNGVNASGSQRRMQLGATSNYINYGLYIDSARTSPWSTTSSATSCTGGAGTCVTGTGTGSSQTVTIYGRVPTQSVPAAGTFSDSVVITVTF
jgi:spore coat protein U-like protein